MRGRAAGFAPLGLALAAGALIAWIDARPGWDDTGVTAGLLFVAAAACGCAWPRQAWLWALAVGAWIPLHAVVRHRSLTMLLVLLIPLGGAYLGVAARRALSPPKVRPS
jgi:hypothetical protein